MAASGVSGLTGGALVGAARTAIRSAEILAPVGLSLDRPPRAAFASGVIVAVPPCRAGAGSNGSGSAGECDAARRRGWAWRVTNYVTIVPDPAGHPRTAPHQHPRWGRGKRERQAPRRCLRDEEAAGSNPATPTTKLHVAARFRKQCRLPGSGQFPVWERTPADLMVPALLTSSNAPCLCRQGGSGLRPLPR
jgi:hypothetical protein